MILGLITGMLVWLSLIAYHGQYPKTVYLNIPIIKWRYIPGIDGNLDARVLVVPGYSYLKGAH